MTVQRRKSLEKCLKIWYKAVEWGEQLYLPYSTYKEAERQRFAMYAARKRERRIAEELDLVEDIHTLDHWELSVKEVGNEWRLYLTPVTFDDIDIRLASTGESITLASADEKPSELPAPPSNLNLELTDEDLMHGEASDDTD